MCYFLEFLEIILKNEVTCNEKFRSQDKIKDF